MGWLSDPKVRYVRRSITDTLRKKEYQFRSLGPVIFLCGADRSVPRERLKEYLERYYAKCHVFYAEHVWDVIAKSVADANALEVESRLAALSDMVVIIVESPGTFAELGAFAISNELRKKLLPVLEVAYQQDPSFIRSGPVHWVDRDSKYAPSIWLPQARILEHVGEIEERLGRLEPDTPQRVADLTASPKLLLFFVCDVVAVFGPCSGPELRGLVQDILERNDIDAGLFAALGKAMGILDSFVHNEAETFFRPLINGSLVSFHRPKKFVDLPTLRAQIVGVMQTSPEGTRVLRAASESHSAAR